MKKIIDELKKLHEQEEFYRNGLIETRAKIQELNNKILEEQNNESNYFSKR